MIAKLNLGFVPLQLPLALLVRNQEHNNTHGREGEEQYHHPDEDLKVVGVQKPWGADACWLLPRELSEADSIIGSMGYLGSDLCHMHFSNSQ